MCTVVLDWQPGAPWPILIAANRDERLDRAWDPPGPLWPDRRGVVAGRDRTAGGTWMAVRGGVVAAVLNRPGSLGPQAGKRSRGDLPLLAVAHESAADAVQALVTLDAGDYRTFNMAVADRDGAWFLRGLGTSRPEASRILPGTHMVTAHDPDDLSSPRVARHLPRFRAAPRPDPDAGDWTGWHAILSDRSDPVGSAINVPPLGGFGTVCSSLLAIPQAGAPTWLFAPGPPDTAPFRPVALPPA